MAEAMKFLLDTGISASDIKLSRPTLEQVYLNIVGSTWK
jgi:hypothetical protein